MVQSWSLAWKFVLATLCLLPTAWSAEEADEPAAAIDLLAAMKAGDIEVKIIPRDEKVGTVIVTNKTGRPLTIKLPEALAGVPVAAQFGGPGIFGNDQNPLNNNNANQGLGVAIRPQGQQNNFGPGIFNVGPERAIKLKFTAVCLEHGKRSPNTRIPYELVPLESFTSEAGVVELVKMLSRREIDQPTAQAAAWHLADGMSWEKLARKISVRHLNGVSERFFTGDQLAAAKDAVTEAERRTAGSTAAGRSIGEALAR